MDAIRAGGRVVVVGSLNEDLALRVRAVPGPGETVLGDGLTHRCGGKGANQAVAAARVGGRVRMVGCVGTDDAGQRMLDALVAATVDASTVRRVDGPSGLAVVLVAADGENAIVVAPGANAACSAEIVTTGLAGLRPVDVVVAQGEIPAVAIRAAAAVTHAAAARFVLNLAPPVPLDLAPGLVDVLVVNQHEAAELAASRTGERTGGSTEHARQLARDLGSVVVVTLGADGVLLAQEDRLSRIAAYPPERIVDTTGAGDAFVGAFAAALADGRSITDATRWGAAAGSITVAAVGAQTAEVSLPRLREVLAVARFDDAQTGRDPLGS